MLITDIEVISKALIEMPKNLNCHIPLIDRFQYYKKILSIITLFVLSLNLYILEFHEQFIKLLL